jgi:hypothetical protein
MLLSAMVCSIRTNSRSGTSGTPSRRARLRQALASPERTRKASNSSGVVRAERGSSSTISTSSFLAGHMHEVHRHSAHGDAQGLGDGLGADAVQRGLLLVDDEPGLRLIGLDIPIHIHHPGGVPEDGALPAPGHGDLLVGP